MRFLRNIKFYEKTLIGYCDGGCTTARFTIYVGDVRPDFIIKSRLVFFIQLVVRKGFKLYEKYPGCVG